MSQNGDQNPPNDTSPLIGPRMASNKLYFLDLNEVYSNSEHLKLGEKSSSLAMDRKILSPDKKEYQLLNKN